MLQNHLEAYFAESCTGMNTLSGRSYLAELVIFKRQGKQRTGRCEELDLQKVLATPNFQVPRLVGYLTHGEWCLRRKCIASRMSREPS